MTEFIHGKKEHRYMQLEINICNLSKLFDMLCWYLFSSHQFCNCKNEYNSRVNVSNLTIMAKIVLFSIFQ